MYRFDECKLWHLRDKNTGWKVSQIRVISLKYKNIVTIKKFPFMTESKFETMVGGEIVHFGGEVTNYPTNCLDQNVDM